MNWEVFGRVFRPILEARLKTSRPSYSEEMAVTTQLVMTATAETDPTFDAIEQHRLKLADLRIVRHRGERGRVGGGLLELSYRAAPNDGSAWTSGDCSLAFSAEACSRTKRFLCAPRRVFVYDEDVRYYPNGFRVARDLD
jgi:hypothetical protein